MGGSAPLESLARSLAASVRARALFLGGRVPRPAPPAAEAAPPAETAVVEAGAPAEAAAVEAGAPAEAAAVEAGAPAEAAASHPAAACGSLEELAEAAGGCRRCRLCEGRSTVVVGEGAPRARLMFVGEAPGFEEDRQGRPFVGRSGQLLTRMIEAMGLSREEVYIANVLKCRPPENRDPAPDEAAACRPWLERQIELIAPEVICTLGRHALSALAGGQRAMGRSRGRPLRLLGRTVVPTFHPAYLLRNPAAKRDAWADLQRVMELLGLPRPEGRAAGPAGDAGER